MSDIIQYYYPVGPYGPICDYVAPGPSRCSVDADCPPGYVCKDGVCVPKTEVLVDDDFENIVDWAAESDQLPEYWPSRVKCKKDPNTGEYYDCVVEWDYDPNTTGYNGSTCLPAPDGSCFNLEVDLLKDFGIEDEFFTVLVGPQTCQPYAPDINIRPIVFVDADGNETRKRAVEKSSPVTYPVDAGFVTESSTGALTAQFTDNGRKLTVGGTGSGQIKIKVSWDDNPSTNGVAFDSITINGKTWTRSGDSGSDTKDVSVESGQTYDITYVNLNSANNPIDVSNSGKKINLKDGDGSDANATVTIEDIYSTVQNDSAKGSLWTETADTYGVWTNPKICTLPCIEQKVTYLVDFSSTSTYYFEFAADNSGEVFFDDEEEPFITATTPTMQNPSIFPQATAPSVTSRNITSGKHKLSVNCTNGAGVGESRQTLYIDSSTVTPGPGTAIRDSGVGISPNDPNTGLNELGGFIVPGDSTTGKYLSFGTLDVTSTPVYTRTASVNIDLSNITRVVFSVIAGSDTNGGERPNDISDTWDVSFDGGSTWIQVAPSKQYSGMEFAEYDATYGSWYDFSVNVPESYRVSGQIINFRSGGDVPEIGTGYGGLSASQVASTYANCGDVFALYRIEKYTVIRGTCDSIHENAWDWSKNPGGWYIKICKGGPCSSGDSVGGWYRVGGVSTWSSLMNKYAVWVSTTQPVENSTQTATYLLEITKSDTYTLEFNGDNLVTIYIDSAQVAQTSDFTNIQSTTIQLNPGNHYLVMEVWNEVRNAPNWSDNPAGAAWLLKDSTNAIIRTSADLTTPGGGNLYWHTRLATGYDYITITS